jgi:hypothetical protein
VDDLCERPTRLGEIFPSYPNYKGIVDADKSEMGLVCLPAATNPAHPPLFWRHESPISVREAVITDDNPKGTVTKSDLELAGTIAHEAVIANHAPVAETTMATGCDNISAVSWRTKGRTTTKGAASYLLSEAGYQQRHYRSKVFYVPGPANHLTNVASRHFDLSDHELLTYFDHYAPQTQPWELAKLPSDVQ